MPAKGKHPGGRPPHFKTAEEMQTAIDAFFADCDKKKEPYTITGLTLALGFADRRSLLDYIERGEQFSHTVKQAKTRVENWLEKRAAASQGVVAGVIFNLKNNFGWRDEKQLDMTTKGKELPTPIYGGISVQGHDGDQKDIPAS